MLTKNVRRSNTELLPMEVKEAFSTNPRGVLPNKEVGGAWTSHQVWRQNLGQGQAKFTK